MGIQPRLSYRLLHKVPLQPTNLPLEDLHLFPAVERPPVVQTQARDHVLLGLVDLGVGLLQLLPGLELLPQGLDLLGDARIAHVLLLLLLGKGSSARGGIADLLCDVAEGVGERGGFLGLVGIFGQVLGDVGDVLGFLFAQSLELLG